MIITRIQAGEIFATLPKGAYAEIKPINNTSEDVITDLEVSVNLISGFEKYVITKEGKVELQST